MGKILAIDYGEKRIGLALTDENRSFVFPREHLINNQKLFANLETLIEEEQVEKVIVGWPVNLQGRPTGQTKKVQKFMDQLKKITKAEVVAEDERFTSQAARQLLKVLPGKAKKQKIDSSSAVIILQDYLAKHA